MSEQLAHELNLIVSDTRYSSEAIGITIRHRWPDIMSALRAPAARVSAPTREEIAQAIIKSRHDGWILTADMSYALADAILSLNPSPSQATDAPGHTDLMVSPEAIDTFLAAEQAREEEREALEPFAKIANEYDDREDDRFEIWKDAHEPSTRITLGQCRRARAAIRARKEAS